MSEDLVVRFRGVRGSIPTPEAENSHYGGNTPCVEIQWKDRTALIIDAGTGLRRLGKEMVKRSPERGCEAHILLSHFHWDHLQGIPFFGPLYEDGWSVTFHSACNPADLRRALKLQTAAPYFPAEAAVIARTEYVQIPQDGTLLDGIRVSSFPLNHPGGAAGFRLDAAGVSVVYACDHEHGSELQDSVVRRYATGADVLIWDSQYTPKEYESHKGWGHGTWREGTRVALDRGVRQLVLFHHDPQRNDVAMARIEHEARQEFEGAVAAREGLDIKLRCWTAS